MADLVLTEVQDGVAVVTLNNPPLNLVTLDLTVQLERAIDDLAADPEARVLVLTGASDRAFCAGSDIKEFADMMAPGVVLDFDADGHLVGIDVDHASKIMDLSRLEVESLPVALVAVTAGSN